MNIFGITESGVHYDVSKTEKGAKRYATIHGFRKVSIRFNGGYIVTVIAEKVGNQSS